MIESQDVDLACYRIEKANVILSEAKIMLEQGHPEASVSRSYYAIFTAARATLALRKLDSKKHSGVLSLFNLHFIKDGILPERMYKVIRGAKTLRERSDYADYVTFSSDDAQAQLKQAIEFVEEIETLIQKVKADPHCLDSLQ